MTELIDESSQPGGPQPEIRSRVGSTLVRVLPDRTSVAATVVLWTPMLGWLLLFQPGMVSPDSLSAWRQVLSGTWTDAHPPLYTAGMGLSHALLSSPVLLGGAQSLLLAAGIVAASRSLVRFGAPRSGVIVAATLLALSPMIGAFSVSLWKDVPYAGAFLFAAARSIDLVTARLERRRPIRQTVSLAIWAALVVLLRQNGVLLVAALFLTLIVVLPGQRRRLVAGLVGAIAVLAVAKAVVYPLAGIRPADSNASMANLLHDIAAHVAEDPAALTPSDRALLEQLGPIETWTDAFSRTRCWSQNWQFDPAFRWEEIPPVRTRLLALWARLAVADPLVEVRNRACVAAIAWSPYPVGPTYTVERSVAPNHDGLIAATVSPELTRMARELLADLDSQPAQSLLWRAPAWMMLAAASVAIAAFRARRALVAAVIVPLGAFVLSVAPVVPSQDARYMIPALMFAVLLLPTAWRTPRSTDRHRPEDQGLMDRRRPRIQRPTGGVDRASAQSSAG